MFAGVGYGVVAACNSALISAFQPNTTGKYPVCWVHSWAVGLRLCWVLLLGMVAAYGSSSSSRGGGCSIYGLAGASLQAMVQHMLVCAGNEQQQQQQ